MAVITSLNSNSQTVVPKSYQREGQPPNSMMIVPKLYQQEGQPLYIFQCHFQEGFGEFNWISFLTLTCSWSLETQASDVPLILKLKLSLTCPSILVSDLQFLFIEFAQQAIDPFLSCTRYLLVVSWEKSARATSMPLRFWMKGELGLRHRWVVLSAKAS